MSGYCSHVLTSIVVATHNAGDMLLDALACVGADRPDVELILVDNGSTDASVDRVAQRYPSATIVRNARNTGYAPAYNQGVAHATGDYALLLNTDAFIEPDEMTKLVRAAKGDPDGAIWQPVNLDDTGAIDSAGDLFSYTGLFVHATQIPDEPLRSIFATKGAALLVRTEAFRELGGFHDDYFAYFEESDLCWRARMAGYEVRLVSSARVRHIGGETTARILAPDVIRYLAFRNRFRTILANAAPRTLLRMVPLHLAACLGFVLVYLATGRPRSAASVGKALWWAVGNADVWREQRANVQASRRLDEADVLRADIRGRFRPGVALRHARGNLFRWEKAAARSAPDTEKSH
jgi:GT2 family glycosyltransferase